jgi:hypothetical protein
VDCYDNLASTRRARDLYDLNCQVKNSAKLSGECITLPLWETAPKRSNHTSDTIAIMQKCVRFNALAVELFGAGGYVQFRVSTVLKEMRIYPATKGAADAFCLSPDKSSLRCKTGGLGLVRWLNNKGFPIGVYPTAWNEKEKCLVVKRGA